MKKTEILTSTKARANMGEYIFRAKFLGEKFVIKKDGKPMARIVPLANQESNKAKSTGKFDFRKSTGILKQPDTEVSSLLSFTASNSNKEKGAKK